jgi:hypothetical protein
MFCGCVSDIINSEEIKKSSQFFYFNNGLICKYIDEDIEGGYRIKFFNTKLEFVDELFLQQYNFEIESYKNDTINILYIIPKSSEYFFKHNYERLSKEKTNIGKYSISYNYIITLGSALNGIVYFDSTYIKKGIIFTLLDGKQNFSINLNEIINNSLEQSFFVSSIENNLILFKEIKPIRRDIYDKTLNNIINWLKNENFPKK